MTVQQQDNPNTWWWRRDPNVRPCPICGCPVQRTDRGTITDGLKAHYRQVHPHARRPQ